MIEPIDGDLSGQLSLVTGASAGIGKEIARDLASLGAEVLLGCRSTGRGEAAAREIAKTVPGARLRVEQVDVSSQASIRALAERLRDVPLRILVNNAGIWAERREKSVDGIELTWATNVLGYFLLTELLRPGMADRGGRIVNVASAYAHGLDLTDVEFDRREWSASAAYAQSKQANRMWTWALARRLEGTRLTANAMHPGAVSTNLLRKGFGMSGRTPEEGADTASWLAADRALEGVSGKFFMDRHERRCEFRNERDEEVLWSLCARMTTERGA